MKLCYKTLFFSAAIFCVLCLSGCGQGRDNNEGVKVGDQIIPPTNNTISNGELKKATGGFMAIADVGAITKEGYYIINPIGDHYNIVYNDFKAKKAVFLCSSPNCFHENEACTSYSKVGGYLFIANEKLLFLASDADLTSEKFEHVLYEMDINGENKRTVYNFKPQEIYMGSHIIASNDKKIYLALEMADDNTKKLTEISIDNGKCNYIAELDAGENIASAYNNLIYTIKPKNNVDSNSPLKLVTEYGAFAFDILAKQKAEVYSFDKLETTEKVLNGGITVQIPIQNQDYNIIENKIYIYEHNEKQLYRIDIASQEKEPIINLSEVVTLPEYMWIDGVMQDILILYAVQSNRRFIVDLKNNTFVESTLTAFGSKTREQVTLDPVAFNGDIVVFYNGGVVYTINQTIKDGSNQSVETMFSTINIISKDDYINNIQSYGVIENGEVFIKATE